MIVVFFAVTSSPLAALFTPLALALVYFRRRSGDIATFGALLVGGVVQGIGMLTTTDYTPKQPSSIRDFALIYPVRVIGSYVLGDRFLESTWMRFGWTLAAGMSVTLILILFVATRRGALLMSWPALAALGYSVAFLVVPVYIRGTLGMRLVPHAFNPNGSRYVVIPVLLLASAIAIWVDAAGWRWLTALFVAHMAVVIGLSFAIANPRSPGPDWPVEVRRARPACSRASTADVQVPISPFGWYAPVPCSRLR
jgi:hypothetical protein